MLPIQPIFSSANTSIDAYQSSLISLVVLFVLCISMFAVKGRKITRAQRKESSSISFPASDCSSPSDLDPTIIVKVKKVNHPLTSLSSTSPIEEKQEVVIELDKWGRNSAPSNITILLSTSVMFLSPLFVILIWNIIHRHGAELNSSSSVAEWSTFLPQFNLTSLALFLSWLLFQQLLFITLPGKITEGQETPAGHVLKYKVNGFSAWVLSNAGLLLFSLGLGVFELSIIADHWEGLLVAANLYGFALTVVAYLKAHYAPSHPNDCKFTGSRLYDLFMGIELNPRITDRFDFKLFHNGRPGIVAWTMINFSFAAAQYNRFGYVTDSMVLVNLLQAIYVVDFFIKEEWYLKTIDIAHDHFGFMLAWGDSVWLPFMYTLQAQYLAYNPVELGVRFWLVLGLGVLGYYVFRATNYQKELCRKSNGNCEIWGRPAQVLRTQYRSSDGKVHQSMLLISGFWGLARHSNYLGDLILSFAMCAACGSNHCVPYFYILFMGILLVHRIERDHARCAGKYGKYWEEYCRIVPYKLIPGVY